ncbi:MAG: LytR C-terminal domain-containing protein [Solirubrobacterales bacterium]
MGHAIEQIGSYAGLAAFLGLGVFALLSFTQARDIRRLREWAGSAPERDADRKETTSTIAAQRAEELRALEEARTAEHAAVTQRETRRQRREEGLPELTRRERIGGFFSRLGERLAEPRWLVVLFVVLVLIVAGVGYALLSGGDEEPANGKSGKVAVAKVKPGEVEVAVLNGTATAGLAATYGDKLEKKGYELGRVTNSEEPAETSVVMFARGHKPEAEKVAKALQISDLRLMTGSIETDSDGADVAVIIGEDDAAEAG